MSVDRDLGFIKWSDKYGKLENMKSNEFKQALADENNHYNSVMDKVPTHLIKKWTQEFNKLPTEYDVYYTFTWLSYTISVCSHNRLQTTLSIDLNNKHKLDLVGVTSFGRTSSRFWYIKDASDGSEKSSLFILDEHLEQIKEIKKVGETAESTDSDIYYCQHEKQFWVNNAYKISNSLKITHLYEEPEEKYTLTAFKPKNQGNVFILRRSAIYNDIAIIKLDTIMWLKNGFGIKIPMDSKTLAYDRYFVTDGIAINYPTSNYLEMGFIFNGSYHFIFKHGVFNSVCVYRNNTWIFIQNPIVATITTLKETDLLLIGEPHKPDRVVSISDKLTLIKQHDGPTYQLAYDDQTIPWFAVHPKKAKKGIVICGYGSYGFSMRRVQQRLWIPWLEQGYVVANICVRGGGENGDMWWDQSRTALRRHVGIDDFISGVKQLQKHYGFSEKNTIIYGRSAGGFLVTAAANKLMSQVAVVYAAKPFTDVLRTVTNRHLSQVMQESEEFGYVAKDPVGFMEIAKVSPYENVIDHPATNPAVLLTGGLNDSEVETYMPLKFVKRLHDAGWKNTVVRIADEGHFTKRTSESGEANDAALCEYFLSLAGT